MLTIYPAFYPAFKCRAAACRHSCCLGWEIDIDDDTAQFYQELSLPLGEEIRRNMCVNAGGSFFRLTKEQRCPFLQQDGLCRLILTLGEDSLCEICTMHPRFFTYLDKLELAGVGLCCEESVHLLLQVRGPLQFYLCEDTPGNVQSALGFADLLHLCGFPVQFASFPAGSPPDAAELQAILTLLSQTEPIDDSWTSLLKKVQGWLQVPCPLTIPPAGRLTKIYQYILYRQLADSVHSPAALLADFARLSTWFIVLAATVTGDLPEAVRLWSAQIEYDTDNVALLLEKLQPA